MVDDLLGCEGEEGKSGCVWNELNQYMAIKGIMDILLITVMSNMTVVKCES